MSLDDTNFSDGDSDQFNSGQPESRPDAQTPSWAAKRCPSCYTAVLHNQVVCAECGTRLVPRLTKVRCLRCGKPATTDHVICPHCGRNLRAAPSRLLTIGAPALLVGALAIVLVARGMPSFLQENNNLPLLQNFVITPASSDSEPTVRLARESLAPAVVQSGPGQSDESAPPAAAPAAAVSTPTPVSEQTATAANGSKPDLHRRTRRSRRPRHQLQPLRLPWKRPLPPRPQWNIPRRPRPRQHRPQLRQRPKHRQPRPRG